MSEMAVMMMLMVRRRRMLAKRTFLAAKQASSLQDPEISVINIDDICYSIQKYVSKKTLGHHARISLNTDFYAAQTAIIRWVFSCVCCLYLSLKNFQVHA